MEVIDAITCIAKGTECWEKTWLHVFKNLGVRMRDWHWALWSSCFLGWMSSAVWASPDMTRVAESGHLQMMNTRFPTNLQISRGETCDVLSCSGQVNEQCSVSGLPHPSACVGDAGGETVSWKIMKGVWAYFSYAVGNWKQIFRLSSKTV